MTPEAKARQTIDALLVASGWHVCNVADANIHTGNTDVKGVAIREFPLNNGFGFADYLLYVNGKACGVMRSVKSRGFFEQMKGRGVRIFNRGKDRMAHRVGGKAWRWHCVSASGTQMGYFSEVRT